MATLSCRESRTFSGIVMSSSSEIIPYPKLATFTRGFANSPSSTPASSAKAQREGEYVLPETDGEQADERVRVLKEPRIALKEHGVKEREEVPETDQGENAKPEDDPHRQPATPPQTVHEGLFQPPSQAYMPKPIISARDTYTPSARPGPRP